MWSRNFGVDAFLAAPVIIGHIFTYPDAIEMIPPVAVIAAHHVVVVR